MGYQSILYNSTCIIMIVHYLQKKTVYFEDFKNMFQTFAPILDKVEHSDLSIIYLFLPVGMLFYICSS